MKMKTSLVVLFSILAVALAIPADDPVDVADEIKTSKDDAQVASVDKVDPPNPEIEGQIPVQIVYGNSGAEDTSNKEHSRPKRFLLSKLLFAKAVLSPFSYRAEYSTAPGGGALVVRKSWNPWFPWNVQVTGSGAGAATGSSSVTQTASAPLNVVYRKTWTPWNVQVIGNAASTGTTATKPVATETAAASAAVPASTATQSVSAPAGYIYTKSFSPWNVQVSSNAISAPAPASEVVAAPASTVTQTFSVPTSVNVVKTWG